jgi:hypothetical protein
MHWSSQAWLLIASLVAVGGCLRGLAAVLGGLAKVIEEWRKLRFLNKSEAGPRRKREGRSLL